MEYIQYNLENISRDYEKMGITSLAMTPIGCGLGRLDYHYNVRPLLYQYLDPIDLEVSILMESELYKTREFFFNEKKRGVIPFLLCFRCCKHQNCGL